MPNILRDEYHNTRFPPQWTLPTYDVVFLGIIACFVVLYLGFLILLPSFKMNKSTLYFYLALTFNLFLGWVIIDCNWAYEWQSASVTTETFYAPYDPRKINATLALHMGLRGFNITLVGIPERQFGQIINYNERFLWSEDAGETTVFHQGRFGYGPYSGGVAQKFREWQFRGYPQIITELAEYFTLDGDEIRWYRWYRIAGWYGHILLWTALPLWALTNALFIMKPSTGALWLIFTGTCMESCIMTYGIIVDHVNHTPLQIQYSGGILKPEFGWTFYLVLVVGVITILVGAAVFVFMKYHPELDHNLLSDPEPTINDDDAEEPAAQEEAKAPRHRRQSDFGHHTVRKINRPSGASVIETKFDAPSSANTTTATPSVVSTATTSIMSAPMLAPPTADGDLPMNRMMSVSGRAAMVTIDESALEEEAKRQFTQMEIEEPLALA